MDLAEEPAVDAGPCGPTPPPEDLRITTVLTLDPPALGVGEPGGSGATPPGPPAPPDLSPFSLEPVVEPELTPLELLLWRLTPDKLL